MATLMRDPVILPSSKAVLDRDTIKSYLLSETRDPFNRQPLTIDQVIPGMFCSEQLV
jgi:ubiquitin conjugation factor E4 B